jgi:Ca2+/Na+ antiporter
MEFFGWPVYNYGILFSWAIAMSAASDRTIRSSSRWMRVVTWLVCFAVIFCFGWYKSSENKRDDETNHTWLTQHKQLSKDADAEWKRLAALLSSLTGRPGSQKQLEAELNDGKPFDLSEKNGLSAATWTHPKYGGTCSLQFQDGVLKGSNAHWGYVPEELFPRPPATARTNVAEWLRRQVARAGVWGWLTAFACYVTMPRRRFIAAHLMLATALACGMAWLVDPHYSLASQGIFNNDNLVLAALMLLLSVWALAHVLSSLSISGELQARFHFGLRELLLLVTVVAMMLAVGPFGYVTLLSLLSCAAAFTALFTYERRGHPLVR